MRLVKYVISVSKRHKNNHAGVKNGTWSIYYYDEDWKLQTKRINVICKMYVCMYVRHSFIIIIIRGKLTLKLVC